MAFEASAVIQEVIELAKEMREAGKRGEKLGLTDADVAFYDSLEVNDSAVKVLPAQFGLLSAHAFRADYD